MAKTHKYLKKRHKTYVLRVPVPKKIQEIMGYKEITRSLKTRDEREHAKLINTDIQQFERGEREDLIEELRYELSLWSSGEFEVYGANLQVMTDRVLIEAGYPTVPLTQMHTLRKGRARPAGSAYVDKSDMKYHQFAELIRKARVQLIETELQLLGTPLNRTPDMHFNLDMQTQPPYPSQPTLQTGLQSQYQAQPSAALLSGQGILLGQLIEEYIDWQQKSTSIRDLKTLEDKKSAFRFLTETVGEHFPVSQLSRQHFLDIQKLVNRFPANARKTKRTRHMDVRALVEDGIKNERKIIGVTKKNKIMSWLSSLMQ